MKVLHIGKYYPPFMGGIEKVNYDIVEGLNEISGFQVDELCFAHKVGFEEYGSYDYKLYRLPIRTIKFSTPIPRNLFSVYKKIRNEYDIIHIHMPNPIVNLAFLLFKTKAKIVLHWHCDIVKKNQQFIKIFYNPLQNVLLKRASYIIGTSEKYAYYSKDLVNFRDKIKIIPIGIDNSYLKIDTKDVDRIKNKYRGKNIVFSLGRLTYYKGFQYLIEAAKFLNDDAVILLGGCGEQEKELKQLAKDLNVDNKVIFLGRVSDDDLGNYYMASDLFCLPSPIRTEAFGVVLLEAMSLGKPIVACTIEGSGVSWVNEDGVTGFNVPTRNPSEMANSINKILSNPILKKKMEEAGKNRYQTMFTKEKMINSIIELYHRIV